MIISFLVVSCLNWVFIFIETTETKLEAKTSQARKTYQTRLTIFFVEIGPKLAANIPPSDIDPIEYVRPCHTEFNYTAITKTVLATTINQIHPNKAPGLDKISNKLIKAAGNAIYDPLLHVFNLILDTGIFPEDLKLTRVTPIHKEGDTSERGNYRPISVIPALAKIQKNSFVSTLTCILITII